MVKTTALGEDVSHMPKSVVRTISQESNRGFWSAFWAGISAPMILYADPPPYFAYVGGRTVSQSFACVGMYLSQAAALHSNDGR